MHNAGDLRTVECAPGLQTDQHRGRRLQFIAQEGSLLGDRQMHAGGAHGPECLDRARQFAFETALVIDLFGELADAELLVLHYLEADQATFRQSL